MNDRCDSSYESRQNPAYQSTLAHFFAATIAVAVGRPLQITQNCQSLRVDFYPTPFRTSWSPSFPNASIGSLTKLWTDPSFGGIQARPNWTPTHSTWLRVVVSTVEPRLKHSGVTLRCSFAIFCYPSVCCALVIRTAPLHHGHLSKFQRFLIFVLFLFLR
jgi:hypothetical protein